MTEEEHRSKAVQSLLSESDRKETVDTARFLVTSGAQRPVHVADSGFAEERLPITPPPDRPVYNNRSGYQLNRIPGNKDTWRQAGANVRSEQQRQRYLSPDALPRREAQVVQLKPPEREAQPQSREIGDAEWKALFERLNTTPKHAPGTRDYAADKAATDRKREAQGQELDKTLESQRDTQEVDRER